LSGLWSGRNRVHALVVFPESSVTVPGVRVNQPTRTARSPLRNLGGVLTTIVGPVHVEHGGHNGYDTEDDTDQAAVNSEGDGDGEAEGGEAGADQEPDHHHHPPRFSGLSPGLFLSFGSFFFNALSNLSAASSDSGLFQGLSSSLPGFGLSSENQPMIHAPLLVGSCRMLTPYQSTNARASLVADPGVRAVRMVTMSTPSSMPSSPVAGLVYVRPLTRPSTNAPITHPTGSG